MSGRVSEAVRCLQEVVCAGAARLSDGELLGAFVDRRDEAAFEALVRRHGPMVLGVCRRALRNSHDAEDAFQATFLVLARKAASVRPREGVGNWLYGVARRTALEAQRRNARRRGKEKQVSPLPESAAGPPGPDLADVLDEELSRLPDKLRLPVVLCDLEGRTRREVARQLGVPDGTLSNRLASARRALAQRLARRGITLGAGAVTASLAAADVPPGLIVSTTRAALAGPDTVPPAVAALGERVLKTMYLSRLRVIAVLFLALAAGLGGLWGAVSAQGLGGQQVCPHPPLAAEPAAPVSLPADPPEKPGKALEQRAVLARAARAAHAIPATKDAERRRKTQTLGAIAARQARIGDRAAAAATFRLALEAAGKIEDEDARGEAQSRLGFDQAHAGLVGDARKTAATIAFTDRRKARHAEDLRDRVLVEVASRLARDGDVKEALKVAEAIPERVFKAKAKKGKAVEHRNSMLRDTALKYVAEAQLAAGDAAGAAATVRRIKEAHPWLWTFREVIVAQARTDRAAAGKLLAEWRQGLEEKNYSGRVGLLASTQAAIGDAEGALAWAQKLKSAEERADALLALSIGMAEREIALKKK